MDSTPAFLRGTFAFEGEGLERPLRLPEAAYIVPYDKRAQLIYFRAGHSADQLVNVVLVRDGEPMRYFPLGARSAMHVPLALIEDLMPDSQIEVHLAAPVAVSGTLILDIGLMEIS